MTLRFRLGLALLTSLAVSLIAPSALANQTPHVTVPRGWPKKLVIPSIGVNANVESSSLSGGDSLHAPYKVSEVAWYNRGPRPGEMGRSTIFGHLDSTCCPAVFYHLRSLKPGDKIEVFYKTGKPVTFRVMWEGSYLDQDIPVKFLFGSTYEHGLNLMTCAGDFHFDGSGYDHKLVVYARLLLPNGKLG